MEGGHRAGTVLGGKGLSERSVRGGIEMECRGEVAWLALEEGQQDHAVIIKSPCLEAAVGPRRTNGPGLSAARELLDLATWVAKKDQ